MRMVTKWIQFKVRLENAAGFREALARLEVASKLETGCVHYAAFCVSESEGEFAVLESWASAETFEAHRVAPHTSEFKEHCGEMIVEKSGQELEAVAG
ncbi:MAG: quinol monooxygenase YgiN [Verrucomicrobiales bacterium]|jgi:quinol monooxygenase YgiN